MATLLKVSTTVTIRLGPALDKTDGVTEETGLSPTVEISKAHGAFAARNSATAITHDSNGWYAVELNATDTGTLGVFIAKFDDASTHLPVWREFIVVPANVFDSLVGGSDVLDVSTTQFNGSAVVQAGGRPEVNTTHAAGTAWASGAITAAVLATDTITAAKIAADAITAAKIADGAIDAATFAAGAINAAAIAADAITAAKIADGAIDAATFAADAITAAKIAADVTTELQSGLATAAALATVGTNVDAILVDTAVIGALGAGLTAIPWNAAWDAEVQSEATDALNAYDPPTNAELVSEINSVQADVAALNNLSAAQVNTEVDTALADIHLDHLLATDYDPAAKPGVATALLNELVESDAGVSRYTANALEQGPGGGSAPTVGEIADAVWDEAIAGHVGAGSTGEALSAAGGAGDPWITALPGAYGAGSAGKIIGDNINATIASRATPAQVNTEADTAIADAALATAANLATVDGIVDSILVDTAEIGAAGAGLTALGDARIANLNATVSSRATPAQVATELATYDGPTFAELDARTDAIDAAIAAVPTTGEIRTELATELGRIDATVSSRATPAQVNTEVLDVLVTDTHAEPAAVPAATSSLKDKLGWLFMLGRNKRTTSATTDTVLADDAATPVATSTISDSGTVFSRGEYS